MSERNGGVVMSSWQSLVVSVRFRARFVPANVRADVIDFNALTEGEIGGAGGEFYRVSTLNTGPRTGGS